MGVRGDVAFQQIPEGGVVVFRAAAENAGDHAGLGGGEEFRERQGGGLIAEAVGKGFLRLHGGDADFDVVAGVGIGGRFGGLHKADAAEVHGPVGEDHDVLLVKQVGAVFGVGGSGAEVLLRGGVILGDIGQDIGEETLVHLRGNGFAAHFHRAERHLFLHDGVVPKLAGAIDPDVDAPVGCLAHFLGEGLQIALDHGVGGADVSKLPLRRKCGAAGKGQQAAQRQYRHDLFHDALLW